MSVLLKSRSLRVFLSRPSTFPSQVYPIHPSLNRGQLPVSPSQKMSSRGYLRKVTRTGIRSHTNPSSIQYLGSFFLLNIRHSSFRSPEILSEEMATFPPRGRNPRNRPHTLHRPRTILDKASGHASAKTHRSLRQRHREHAGPIEPARSGHVHPPNNPRLDPLFTTLQHPQ